MRATDSDPYVYPGTVYTNPVPLWAVRRRTMSEFLRGFIKGAKETPRGFFAPAVAIWRLLLSTTESLLTVSK